MKKILLIILLVFLLSIYVFGQGEINKIKKNFQQPTSENKPWVYWGIMDGHFNKKGITADLEAMKKVGIGGVLFMEVNLEIERGKVEFMSNDWRESFKHAIKKTETLGMEFTLGTGPGWTGSGGPWVSTEESMLHLVSSSTDVSGNVDIVLPRPQPEAPYFGMWSLDEKMKAAREKFYKDVCVLAYPKIAKDSAIDYTKEKALYIRRPYSSEVGALPNIEMPSSNDIKNNVSGLVLEKMIDVTSYKQPNGRLVWKAPAGEWTIFRFGITTTGANTRPAPIPGYGFECNKLDTNALNNHLENFQKKLIDDLGIKPTNKKRATGWNMMHIDSWEMGAQNWTSGFADEFKKRRRYDITPYLPAYSGQIVGNRLKTERFLWDMRMTAQELMLENHARHVKNFAHKYGMGLSIEPYDMNPASDLALGAIADVPMGEFWTAGNGFVTQFSCTEAVSIAHTNNKNIVAAESMTNGHSPAWADYPVNLKNQIDWAFCTGINRLTFHVYAMQPYLDRFPGMTFGPYGSFYTRNQTWWNYSNEWHEYLTRCQYMLRQGKPVADILFLNPEGVPAAFEPPVSAMSENHFMPDRKGFNFDGCDPLTFMSDASVKNGKIVFPGDMEYSILVLPNTEYMTPELLKKVYNLIDKGATVIGFPPKMSPSLVNFPKCDEEVSTLANKMWGDDTTPKKIGKGILYPCTANDTLNLLPTVHGYITKIYKGFIPPFIQYSSIEKVLHQMGIIEDFVCDKPFRYIHRKLDNGDIYFVSNTLGTDETGQCTFRANAKFVTLLNPMDGKEYAANLIKSNGITTTVNLQLEPNGSVFVLFSNASNSAKNLPDMFPEFTIKKEIDTPWLVSFNTRFGGPANTTFNKLIDWSTCIDTCIKYYSGTAKYSTNINLTASEIKGRTFLDLGKVEVIARIKVNGKDLGVAWKSPYQIEITGALKTGKNSVEVEVANLWVNRLIGDLSLPENRRYTWTTYNPFKGTDKLLPSGLIGPVVIKMMKNTESQ